MTTKSVSRWVGLAAALCTSLPAVSALAQSSDNVIRIGVMNDQSGPYADNCGPGSVAMVKLAVEDFGGAINGVPVEVVVADDQNKPDIGLSIAKKWVESEGVDVIVGCSISSIALAISEVMAGAQKPYLIAGSASSALTNEGCAAMSQQWAIDTFAAARGTIKSMLDQGKKTYFFITVDYAFGKQSEADATRFITEGGGTVVGNLSHPLGATDFSSYLLQAQASGAEVIVVANGGADTANLLKQAREFGIAESGIALAPLGLQFNDVLAIGLDVTKGMMITSPSYWALNDQTKALSERYAAAFRGRMPNEKHLSTYSAVNHYLKAVTAAGTDDGVAINAKMRELPVSDFMIANAEILANGQVTRPMLALKVKDPSASTGQFDVYEVVGEIPAAEAWRPVAESQCPLMKQ